jgi:hypothetical protein
MQVESQSAHIAAKPEIGRSRRIMQMKFDNRPTALVSRVWW